MLSYHVARTGCGAALCMCVGRVWRHGGEVTGLIGGPSRVEATGGTGLCVCSALGSRLLVRLEGQASMLHRE